jgi:hypothetical protein
MRNFQLDSSDAVIHGGTGFCAALEMRARRREGWDLCNSTFRNKRAKDGVPITGKPSSGAV